MGGRRGDVVAVAFRFLGGDGEDFCLLSCALLKRGLATESRGERLPACILRFSKIYLEMKQIFQIYSSILKPSLNEQPKI